MRMSTVSPEPAFYADCIKCGRRMLSNRESMFADLDGEPFKAYYCQTCKASLTTSDRE